MLFNAVQMNCTISKFFSNFPIMQSRSIDPFWVFLSIKTTNPKNSVELRLQSMPKGRSWRKARELPDSEWDQRLRLLNPLHVKRKTAEWKSELQLHEKLQQLKIMRVSNRKRLSTILPRLNNLTGHNWMRKSQKCLNFPLTDKQQVGVRNVSSPIQYF